ncbi:MAG: SRPBCC domain-containing protein [Bacteroidetes bacterium]|nr:SRPBCC domain-containing protein [Bacteroidota bacterium]
MNLKRITFSTKIKASKSEVWKVLLDDTTYRQWTSVFSEGSYAVTDWKEGSKVLFLDAKGDGMYSTIVRNIPNEFISFKHLGEVKNGIEKPFDLKTKEWEGAMENYTLKEIAGLTELTVELDGAEDSLDFFKDAFPKALEKVKTLSETKATVLT